MTQDLTSQQSELDVYRHQINEIDQQILSLLAKRSKISIAVGEYKRKANIALPIYQPQRERQLLDNLFAFNAGLDNSPLTNKAIVSVWNEILSSSRALQKRIRVAYLGPEGTFSHMAALECLGHSIDPTPKPDFAAICMAVADGDCDLGLLPLENSLHGSIGQSYDLFVEYPIHIVGEHYSRISHCLMSTSDSLDKISRVYSHPQPFGQCADWLRKNLPSVPLIPEESTAAAARRSANEPNSAAIGHKGLAEMLGLHILASPIEDFASNWTRFAIIAPGGDECVKEASGESIKTTFWFRVPNSDKPGALTDILGSLGRAGVNMSKLESRPMRGATWQYVFFVDVGCNLLAPEYAAALNSIKDTCETLRIMGVYPGVWNRIR